MQKLKQELNANPVGANCVRPHFKGMTQNKGITLIALIITIIVMLILVGVTINVALNGGLFDKADEATKQTQIEAEKEELLSAVVAAIGNDGKVDFNYLDNNLPAEWDGRNGTYTSPKRNTYTVDPNGKITKGDNGGTELDFEAIKQNVKSNPEAYLAKAKAAGQDIEAITDIGIGTDGEIVNLGLWAYYLEDEQVWLSADGSNQKAYLGDFNSDGTIKGTVPEYIYAEGTIFPVVYMGYTFYNCTELKIAPKIPETVTDLSYTFYKCTELKIAPKIPESVDYMDYTFMDCTSLVTAPVIPDAVSYLGWTFSGCTSLITAPEVPINVTDVPSLFEECTNLSGYIIINTDNINGYGWDYNNCLYGVGSAEKPIILKGTGNNLEILERIKATGNSEYITIEQ